jgi:nucleoside-diphosphate-sugar epimerase
MSAIASERVVAVTGAAGFLGRVLCRHLVRSGFDVRALVREPRAFAEPGVAAAGRCNLPGELDEALLDGAASVVHCAWATRTTDLAQAQRTNEEGTRLLLNAARTRGVSRVVFVSSIAARTDAPSYYGRSKHRAEGLLDPARDLVVRPGLILGREGRGLFQQLLGSMRRLRVVPVFSGGRQPLQTVHVDDVCEAVCRGLERRLTGAVNVAEPEPLPMATFLHLMADRLGIGCFFVPVPFAPVLAVLRGLEALRVPVPLRSESLLGLQGMRRVEVRADLDRLGMTVRPAADSLTDLLGAA